MAVESLKVSRARVVLPIRQPRLPNAAVVVSGGRIQAVGQWKDLRPHCAGSPTDLGEVALLPGLVNAHCHLDYTDMAGQLAPSRSFTDWIKRITELKGAWNRDDFARSWWHGAQMLIRTGTTVVGDVESAPDLLPEMWQATPLRLTSFIELTGVKSRRTPRAILDEALAAIAALPRGRHRAFLSPHAPYSTPPELLRRCGAITRRRRWRITTHVAESEEEYAMFTRRGGPMFDWLERNQRDMSDCGGISPIQHLARQNLLGDRLLAVHANYLDRGDADLLAINRVHVIHCPRSHAYFGHRPFPVTALMRRGVNVCLGTDSLATVATPRGQTAALDLFEEMRVFAQAHPRWPPDAVLRLATLNGARALGFAGRVGEITPGAWADLIAIPSSVGLREVAAALVHNRQPVVAAMIGGEWIAGFPGAYCTPSVQSAVGLREAL